MFINPALAQEVVTAAVGTMDSAVDNPLRPLFQFLVIFVIFYFLLIRPQQKKVKEHQCMQMSISRGDTIVTNGGIVGKVIRSDIDELLIEIADGVRVRVVRDRVLGRKTEPSKSVTNEASVNDNKKTDSKKKGSEGLKDILTKK